MTGINEKLPQEEAEVAEVGLTEDQVAELENTPANQLDIEKLVEDFNQVLTIRDKQQEIKENELTHAFMTVNQSITALNSKIDVMLEHLVDKGEFTIQDVTEKIKVKLEEATELQKKAIQEAIARQQEAIQKEASNG